jgi:peptide/nickel transport system substrate-binding protein
LEDPGPPSRTTTPIHSAGRGSVTLRVGPLPFDVPVHAWFDPAPGYPPAGIHREYFHSVGAFLAGPRIPEFEELMARSVVEANAEKLADLAKEIVRLVYDDALSVLLCYPMALVAVNRYVKVTGHAATLELAETEVTEEHWLGK